MPLTFNLRNRSCQSAFHIQHRITLLAYDATEPEWFVKHLLKTSHNGIPGFRSDAHWQFGLLPKKIFKTGKLRTATRKDDSSFVDVAANLGRKLGESRVHYFNYLANYLQDDGIDFAGCDVNSSGTPRQNIESLDRHLLSQVGWNSR